MEVIAWQPHPEIKGELTVHSCRYEDRTLSIVFRDEKDIARCRMTFPFPMAFRCTDELNLCNYDEGFISKFNILKTSAYLDWFRQLSGCDKLNENVAHYAIFTWSDCFEIITMIPPEVTWEILSPKQHDTRMQPPWLKTV